MENKVLRFAFTTGAIPEESDVSTAQAEWDTKRLELLKAYDIDPDKETPEMTKIIEATIGQRPE